jgi:hypothetical protein
VGGPGAVPSSVIKSKLVRLNVEGHALAMQAVLATDQRTAAMSD